MREGWELKKLSEVCEVLNGGTPKTKVKEYWDGSVLWVTPKDLGQLTTREVTDTPRKITDKGLQNSSAKLIPKNSVIMSTRAPIGHLAVNTEAMATNQGCRGMIPGVKLDVNYLYYFCYKSVGLFNELGTGATFKELSSRSLKNVEIPIPSLPEQKRIVAILDEAFEALDRAKASIEKNIQNADELFQSKLNEIFSLKSEGWQKKKLGVVCGFQNGFAFKSKTYKTSGVPIIRIRDIQGGGIDLSHVVFVDPADYKKELSSFEVTQGDLLIAMSGATTGKIGVVNSDQKFFLNQRVGKFEPENELEKDYLYYYLRTKVEEALEISAGSAQPNLSTKQIKNFKIPLPSVEQQRVVTEDLNKMSHLIREIGTVYKEKIDSLEELKNSLLQEAFSGELTANEPIVA